MKEIMLTQGRVALVDDEDYEWLNQWKWHVYKDRSGKFYARRSQDYTAFYMAREIMKAKKSQQVDHIDGDTLNNQRYNLRRCTQEQNTRNRTRPNKNSKSGYKNIHYGIYPEVGINKPWHVYINVKGKKYSKHCSNLKEAIEIRNKKLKELHGEFANTGDGIL